ncbi:MAG: NAD(P)/FAD-dependent oxidoreductase [Anaerolineaceae bacterium]|nr:MAG: NAD(P)/FAD-dependent oxidoreductase [Anaerolineaceae bacterium]
MRPEGEYFSKYNLRVVNFTYHLNKMKKTTTPTTGEPIIIGGGPAGLTCALQLKRYGLGSLLLEKRELGGLLWNANLVENYPGFPNGIEGSKLSRLMKKQIERIGVDVEREEVVSVRLEKGEIIVETQNVKRKTKCLVIASGTKSKPLPEIISPKARKRIFTEVWPIVETTEKQIVIIGAGDAAFDYALNLAKKRNFVTILTRGETVKCLPLLFERAAQETRIAYRAGVAVSKIEADETADRLVVESGAKTFEADYVIFAIGRVPNLDFLSDEIRQREKELIEMGRLYFIGDVKNELYRQVIIAAGDGLRAAMQIYARITNETDRENG